MSVVDEKVNHENVPNKKLPQTIEKHRSRKSDASANFLRAARSGNLEKVLEHLRNNTDINVCNANGMNALHLAAKEGHALVITELLKRGAFIDSVTKKGNTAIHIASLAGKIEAVETLIKHRAKVNIQSQNGFSPLYMAAQENHLEIVKLLLGCHACPSLSTEDGFTPLAVALQQGHDKVVSTLIEHDSRGKVHLPALHMAAKKDDVKAAALLLQNEKNMSEYKANKSKDFVNDTTKSGFTPLHIAAHYGNTNIAQLLIDKKADVNYSAKNSITPLHVASKWGKNNIVSLLLDHHANIEAKTRDGLTPLHCAARSGNSQTVDLLLERGSQVLTKTQNGLGALHMAVQGDHVDCSRLLLYHKAPIDDVTMDYLTPLHVASHCGNVKTAKLLLERKCDVNARALNGFTPLHIACKKNRLKVVEILVRYGACIESTTESGLTCLHVVSFMGHASIVSYLLQHGANPNTATIRGETPLHLAARASHSEIVKILLRNAANVDARAKEEQTPLHIASRLDSAEISQVLIEHGAFINALMHDNYTPLHLAAKEGHINVVKLLLSHSAQQTPTLKQGFSPLHTASKFGREKVIKVLLENNADVNGKTKNGLTPLHLASYYDQTGTVLVLLEAHADTSITVKNGFTPLHIAARKNFIEVAEALLNHKCLTDVPSKNGYTPLHLAAMSGHTEVVQKLLKKRCDVNPEARNCLTPLHLAAQGDHVEVARFLIMRGGNIECKTKLGYTPLLLACHYGNLNMIRFLLDQSASVHTTTKFGYTALHQASQQGHIAVVILLLKQNASPNVLSQSGLTPLSIAEKMGYISIVEMLKKVTEKNEKEDKTTEKDGREKCPVLIPEAMHESNISDSDDEKGNEELMEFFHSVGADYKLQDDSIYVVKEEKEMFESTTTQKNNTPKYQSEQEEFMSISGSTTFQQTHLHQTLAKVSAAKSRLCNSLPPGQTISPIRPSLSEADCHLFVPPTSMYYTGQHTFTSVSADNITAPKHKLTGSMVKWKSFLVSFMIDARGGAMQGSRRSGVRLIVPPNKACMPTRITCKVVKTGSLFCPPPLMEGESLASRMLQMGPVGTKFLGPVVIEVPHMAALRDGEREVVVLRSDSGDIWREHTLQATEEAVHEALSGSFTDIGSTEEIEARRVVRILTTDFPQYFAVVTRCKQEACIVGSEGGILSSSVIPQVQAVFPPGALLKSIKVGLQVQPVYSEVVHRLAGNRVAVSPIVTLEPRRRKFHRAITLTIPMPSPEQREMITEAQSSPEMPSLHLLCSITGKNRGTSPSQWEDITGTTPLTFIDNTITFTTSVSARFWLMDCQNSVSTARLATELHKETIIVPYIVRFVIFARHHTQSEARIRVVCTTEDKVDKSLENKEKYVEVARSREVEILDSKKLYIEMIGNLCPIIKAGEKLSFDFRPFVESRFQFTVRIRDLHQELFGRIAFVLQPRDVKTNVLIAPVCNLNIVLPSAVHRLRSKESADESARILQIISGCESMKDSLMSSSLGSSSHHVQSDASFEDRELYKNSNSFLDVTWSEPGSCESKDLLDNDQTLYDDLLTPVIEEQERSCEDTSFERLKSLKEECEDVSESTMQGNGNGSGATTDLLLDDDKTPVNPLDEAAHTPDQCSDEICSPSKNTPSHSNAKKVSKTSHYAKTKTIKKISDCLGTHKPEKGKGKDLKKLKT